MSNVVELPIIGQATVRVLANLRQGAPSLGAPVVQKLPGGSVVQVVAYLAGDVVQGNGNWFRLASGGYLWSGACGDVRPIAASPAAAGVAGQPGLDRMPMVVDLYHGDGVASFADAKAAGVVGVIHKATTGATGRDDAYRSRRAAADAAGLLWGAYHWGTAAPIADQVQNFLDWAQLGSDTGTLVALDFESSPGNQMTLDGARQFCQAIFDALGRRPVLYSGATIKSELGGTVDPFFGQHRLWLSQYGASPIVQRSWKSYWLWQYTDGTAGPGVKTVPGILGNAKGELDCNFFPGTAEELAQQWVG